MKKPVLRRKEIPYFYNKTEKEFQEDPYERYDPMVIRQSALHLTEGLWDAYPMQAVFDFFKQHWPKENNSNIVEIGCGVGRMIGNIAQQFPNASCWGLDYSYQMLKQAYSVWKSGDHLTINLSRYGFSSVFEIKGHALANIQFGLAKAANLPFEDQSQDVVLSSFLLDRVWQPMRVLKEMRRVLKPHGKIMLVTPLNFNKSNHWEDFYPPVKIYQQLLQAGFEILDWQEDMIIEEPLDLRGNKVVWTCVGIICR